MTRARTAKAIELELLVTSRRRCALCFGLNHDVGLKAGQIAHVDRDSSDSALDNLAWLCLVHHDEYDTRRSQSKGFTPDELRRYRDEANAFIVGQRAQIEPGRVEVRLSDEALILAGLLNRRSRNGYTFDPQIRIATIPDETQLSTDDIELAIDELLSTGLAHFNGSRDSLQATNRLFWETDAVFTPHDPAADAETVAKALVAGPADQVPMSGLAQVLDWLPRRLNPAATYLVENEKATGISGAGSAPFRYTQVWRTTATKRLVRDLERNS